LEKQVLDTGFIFFEIVQIFYGLQKFKTSFEKDGRERNSWADLWSALIGQVMTGKDWWGQVDGRCCGLGCNGPYMVLGSAEAPTVLRE